MNGELVSIIIPAYNRAAFVAETLESIAAQTYANWECIVVDDGSTDDTPRIVSEFVSKDSRFRLFHRPEHLPKGANACRNFGFEMSKGTFVNWVDSDDILHRDFIAKKVDGFKHGDFDFVASKTVITGKDLSEVRGYEKRTVLSQDLFNDFVCFKVKFFTFDVMFKRSFLKGKTLWDPVLLKGQDYDFYIRMLHHKPSIFIVDEYLYYHRVHEGSITNCHSHETAASIFYRNRERIRSSMFNDFSREARRVLARYHLTALIRMRYTVRIEYLFWKDVWHLTGFDFAFFNDYMRMVFQLNIAKLRYLKRMTRPNTRSGFHY